jgi:hypothetical protein
MNLGIFGLHLLCDDHNSRFHLVNSQTNVLFLRLSIHVVAS